jgi:hypothetical protein
MPYLWCNLHDDFEELSVKVYEWIKSNNIRTLNVAGSRQSTGKAKRKSVGHAARKVLVLALTKLGH